MKRRESTLRRTANAYFIHTKKENGITLVALVVTIIVLIILAGVSINLVLGDNGIITRAKQAKENMKLADEEEAIKLIVTGKVIDGTIEKDKIQAELDKKFGTGNTQAVESGNGTITVEIKDSNGRQYAIESNGNVIREDKWDGVSVTEPTQITETEMHINTAAEFKWFEQQVNAGNVYEGYTIYLENSLDFGAREVNGEWETEANETLKWTPIGKSNILLATFEGNGNTIRGIYINSDTNFNGIFGNSNSIQNLTIKDSYIKGGSATAGIVGGLRSGKIENCHNINTKVVIQEGEYYLGGGIVGQSQGQIKNCTNSGEIIGYGIASDNSSRVGGIVGMQASADEIYNCINRGSIMGEGMCLGGIIGIGFEAVINDCYNTGEVTGNKQYVGGVVGGVQPSSTINGCYNIGSVTGNAGTVGGIVGNASKTVTINNCYNTGEVTGNGRWVGGITASISDSGTISNCYNTGAVTGSADYVAGITAVTGVSATVSNSYNRGTVTGNGKYTGGVVGSMNVSVTVNNCYNTGMVTGKVQYTGGIAGVMAQNNNVTNNIIEKCYNSGKVNGELNTGGIVGAVGGNSGEGTVIKCYSKGEITGTTGLGAVIGGQENTTGLNTLNNLYYLNTVGIRAIGDMSSNNSSDDETNKIMSTEDDLKSYEEFLKWIENK